VPGVAARFADEENREDESRDREDDAEIERFRSQPVGGGDGTGRESRAGKREVAGGLVESHREPAPCRADEVDLHDDRRRPAESLVDPEEDVGEDDPFPGRGKHDHKRDRQADEPTGDQDLLAPNPVGEAPGEEVRQRLDETEGDDEGEGNGPRGPPELLLRQERHDRPLQPGHPANEGVDDDEQGELFQVLAQSEADRRGNRRARRPHSGSPRPPDRSDHPAVLRPPH
jgi:hypothetical protein